MWIAVSEMKKMFSHSFPSHSNHPLGLFTLMLDKSSIFKNNCKRRGKTTSGCKFISEIQIYVVRGPIFLLMKNFRLKGITPDISLIRRKIETTSRFTRSLMLQEETMSHSKYLPLTIKLNKDRDTKKVP